MLGSGFLIALTHPCPFKTNTNFLWNSLTFHGREGLPWRVLNLCSSSLVLYSIRIRCVNNQPLPSVPLLQIFSLPTTPFLKKIRILLISPIPYPNHTHSVVGCFCYKHSRMWLSKHPPKVVTSALPLSLSPISLSLPFPPSWRELFHQILTTQGKHYFSHKIWQNFSHQ